MEGFTDPLFIVTRDLLVHPALIPPFLHIKSDAGLFTCTRRATSKQSRQARDRAVRLAIATHILNFPHCSQHTDLRLQH